MEKRKKKSFDERVDNTFLPEDFVSVFEIRVKEVDAVEKSVHKALDEFRYITKSSQRKTEFFYETPVVLKKAYDIVSEFEIEDVTEDSVLEVEEAGWSRYKKRTFKSAGIPIGTELTYYFPSMSKHGTKVTTVDDETTVLLNGEVMRISHAANTLSDRPFYRTAFECFKLNDKFLWEVHNEFQNRNKN